MSEDTRRDDGTVSGDQQCDRVCDEFRRLLSTDSDPRIEQFLQGAVGTVRDQLLQALVSIELAHRERRGEKVQLWEYYRRFPQQTASIDAAAKQHERQRMMAGAAEQQGLISSRDAADSAAGLVSEGAHSWDPESRRIAQFQLLEHLGEGRYGSVWKARDRKLDRTVAVKIPRQRAASPRQIELFLREARAAAQVRHPNLVSIFEVGRESDTIFMATEFIQGVNLKEFLETKGPRPPRQAADFCAKIAEALACAHQAGVIHRDLKPSNILVDLDGQPHVADFGLAKRQDVDLTMTVDGQVLGTPAYMSPEQADGQARSADQRADIYALGVILFELVTGELPFRGDRKMLMIQKLQGIAPSPRQLNSQVTRDLETVCLKCLERDPSRRYQDCRELATDLRHCAMNRPIRARRAALLARAGQTLFGSRQAALITAGSYNTGFAASLVAWSATMLLASVSSSDGSGLPPSMLRALALTAGTVGVSVLATGLATLAANRTAQFVSLLILLLSSVFWGAVATGVLAAIGDTGPTLLGEWMRPTGRLLAGFLATAGTLGFALQVVALRVRDGYDASGWQD